LIDPSPKNRIKSNKNKNKNQGLDNSKRDMLLSPSLGDYRAYKSRT
jgi:hypothetical protein